VVVLVGHAGHCKIIDTVLTCALCAARGNLERKRLDPSFSLFACRGPRRWGSTNSPGRQLALRLRLQLERHARLRVSAWSTKILNSDFLYHGLGLTDHRPQRSKPYIEKVSDPFIGICATTSFTKARLLHNNYQRPSYTLSLRNISHRKNGCRQTDKKIRYGT